MALSRTDIANQALIRIGAQRIMSIDDLEAKGAVLCRTIYDATLAEIARAGEWNSLKRRATLGRLTQEPEFGWKYQYRLPPDFVDMVQLNGVRCYRIPVDDWEIEGDRLLTNAGRAEVQYIALIGDPTHYDPLFTAALVTLIGAKLAVAMRQDSQVSDAMMNEYYRVTLPRARSKDANQQRVARFDPAADSAFINARFRSTNG